MKTLLLLFISFVFLTGCSSLDTRNIIKTGVTTAVTSVVAGPVPAIANLVASVAIDEVLPEPGPKIEDIKSNKQLVAYMWSEFKELILYGAIAFFAFTTVITPWAVQRRARRKRKYDQYKHEAKLARESNARDN